VTSIAARCPQCGAPATDHGEITQCTADVTHIDVYDLAAVQLPITLRRKPGPEEPRTRPEGLTRGEIDGIRWARQQHHERWGARGRTIADAARRNFPWDDDAELARILLWIGSLIERTHTGVTYPPRPQGELSVLAWARVFKTAAVELAQLDLDDPRAG
jgi:hypothetical protein